MTTTAPSLTQELHRSASHILHDLGIPVHRIGYKQLCLAITCFSEDDTQSLTKELYPYIAKQFGCADWRPVERSIRLAIFHAWSSRDPDLWNEYFSCSTKPPTNKQFIATVAEML